MKQPAHRISARPAGHPQQTVQCPVGPGQFGVSKTACPRNHPDDKSGEGVGQGNGIGADQLPRQMRLHLLGKTGSLKKGDEAGQAAEGRYGAWRLGKLDFGFPEKRAYNRVHRSVPSCRMDSWFEPMVRQFSGTERLFSSSGFRGKFYALCWHLGGSQTGIANLKAEDIDWTNQTIAYARRKTGSLAMIHFGPEVEAVLRRLSATGLFFPYLQSVRPGDRATEFKQRCQQLGIKGVTLHSHRYAWAERAKQCGYPERFAQEALGHNSKAASRHMDCGSIA